MNILSSLQNSHIRQFYSQIHSRSVMRLSPLIEWAPLDCLYELGQAKSLGTAASNFSVVEG
jgi:hypothetical protein